MSQSSNQDKKSYQLNPSAIEFVPNFMPSNTGSGGVVPSSAPNHTANTSYQNKQSNNYHHQNNQRYQQNNNYYNNNNNNNRSNNQYRNNNNNNYYHNNNNNNHNSNNYYYNNNQYDVDPIEIEARCEAVIEILQDDQVRDHLNPVSRYPAENVTNPSSSSYNNQSNTGSHHLNYHDANDNYDDNLEGQVDDEEELLEMMAMQEECRLEMMKFYIQSQNPNLFEEIYHDVSYPEGIKKEEATLNVNKQHAAQSSTSPTKEKVESTNSDSSTKLTETETLATTEKVDSQASQQESEKSIKDQLIENLNPDAYEFVPDKLADLKLDDVEVEAGKDTKKDEEATTVNNQS